VEINGEKLEGTAYRCQHFNRGCQAKVWMIGDQYGKETTVEHHAANPFDVANRENPAGKAAASRGSAT